eukprot:CAMPEP_0181438698 /NCGR_PEP_ID=MMETSP1110-20121109/22045_1 /TAXON_ID=174948 /ORGANISM="Symbiodinium sp., Strain CCMP421" /LENGTH=273 /DNA_ID=CAMNT_0023562397 /DNA_START=21 /DNA_END=842 /DNA_ORIENTATION=+
MDLLGWEPLREAARDEDYEAAMACLLEGMRYTEPMELLQLLRGVLAEVIKKEEAAAESAKESRAKRGSGFSSKQADSEASAQEKDPKEAATRRWRRTLRAVFNAEAAIAMLGDLQQMYKSEEFERAARGLNIRWRGTGKLYAEKMADIEELCLKEVMGPVLARYGFTPDKKGSTELRAVIADLANQSKEIRLMNTEIQKLVISNFPDLRGDKVPLQKSGTPGSTAASTAPPSADEEEPSGESPVSDGSRPAQSAYNWHPGLEQVDVPPASAVK